VEYPFRTIVILVDDLEMGSSRVGNSGFDFIIKLFLPFYSMYGEQLVDM
jgi:hypothetical protein